MLPLNAVALAAAVAFALGSGAGVRTSHLCLATLAGYLLIVHSTVLLLGLAGHLSLYALAIVVTGTFIVATWLAECPRKHGALEPPPSRPPFSAVALFSPLAASAAFLAWMWPHLFDATRLWVWDDYTYHMVYPALWLRDHAIAAPDRQRTRSRCRRGIRSSASVIAAWFMLPFRRTARRGAGLGEPDRVRSTPGIFAAGAAELLAPPAGVAPAPGRSPVILFADVGADRRSWPRASRTRTSPRRRRSSARFVFAVPRGDDREPADVDRTTAWYAALLTRLRARGEGERGAGRADRPRDHRCCARRRAPDGGAAAWPITRPRSSRSRGRRRPATGTRATSSTPAIRCTPPPSRSGRARRFPETTLREYASHYGLRRAVDGCAGRLR